MWYAHVQGLESMRFVYGIDYFRRTSLQPNETIIKKKLYKNWNLHLKPMESSYLRNHNCLLNNISNNRQTAKFFID
jgi:hypothetical protein